MERLSVKTQQAMIELMSNFPFFWYINFIEERLKPETKSDDLNRQISSRLSKDLEV